MKTVSLFLFAIGFFPSQGFCENIEVRTATGTSKDAQLYMGDPSQSFKLVYSTGVCEKPCLNLPAEILEAARDAWQNLQKTSKYFLDVHGLASIDGKGTTIRAITYFDGAHSRNNAHWDDEKGYMVFGAGDPSRFYSFSRPLDLTAHELTHALTSRTANLAMSGESGALNESYSDIFGKLVEFHDTHVHDWLFAHKLYKDPKKFMRDMQNPLIGHVKSQLFKNQVCTLRNDYCAVHKNSGIPTLAAVFLMKMIGEEKLGKIYYLTLTQLLSSHADFHEARMMTEKACGILYGAGDKACKSVPTAFAAVGIN